MPFTGLSEFISLLEKKDELLRVKNFTDPILEITEITDRISKAGGKALLFENTGTPFPVLINAFGSEERMTMALSLNKLGDAAADIFETLTAVTGLKGSLLQKISRLPLLLRISGYLPARSRRKGICQEVIHTNPDLSILPVLKCWPHDGGRFITLPVVHTVHPATGKTNAGMYRMQVLDNQTTGMHWQLHKTGAGHFEEWKKRGEKMPVTVTLGGDPVYTYASTAPLPEGIDEYILAGFLRKKKVKLVKCLTNDLYVPSDADIVIEGYVDPLEAPVLEGPFGDHTGFYSLPGPYPKFHVTCITHSKKAVYPATIVGIPPMEDSFLALATEKIFLAPVRFTILPELQDLHMPVAGVAHNLAVVKIRKSYPGQGKKVINTLLGAGQMMFTKYLIVVSGEVDIRNYGHLTEQVLRNTSFRKDLMFLSGPLDVLDHSSEIPALGGKLGIDATEKLAEELCGNQHIQAVGEFPVIAIGVNQAKDHNAIEEARSNIAAKYDAGQARVILAVDDGVNVNDFFQVAWQVLGNSDPQRDAELLSDNMLFIDGTVKAFRNGGFPRQWPNIVISSMETVAEIDRKWESLGIGPFIPSPTLRNIGLLKPGRAAIVI